MYQAIYIRADGGPEIGLGHLVRCIALAQMLDDYFKISFVSKQMPESVALEIESLGFDLLLISEENEFFSILEKRSIVVLDHYGLDSSYQRNVKELGCILVCIDDLHDRVFYADLIINHSPGICATDYQAQLYTTFALGLKYVLLRPPFLLKARDITRSVESDEIKSIFVCFGGSDYKNLTSLTVDILKDDRRFKKVDVVVGSSYIYLDELKKSTSGDSRFSLHIAASSDTMCEMISEADLSIVPASGILQEAISVGKRVISGMYADNQKYIFEEYKKLNAFESAGNFSRASLRQSIEQVLRNPRRRGGRPLVDGLSSQRLLKYFKQFKLTEHVIVRPAEERDLQVTFNWASNQKIRQFFYNRSPVDFEAHKSWFISKLEDTSCYYYLGLVNGDACGSVRFDVQNGNAVISYLVDPDFQNKGLGLTLLQKAQTLFMKQAGPDIKSISGEVLWDNVASAKIFERLGFDVKIDRARRITRFEKLVS